MKNGIVPFQQRFRGWQFIVVLFVVTSLICNRSPRSSFLHDPQCVTFPHEKSQSICVSVVAELFNDVRNELALLLGRENNLWILQVPRNVFCPLYRSVSHSLRGGQSTVIFLLILFHSLLQKQQKRSTAFLNQNWMQKAFEYFRFSFKWSWVLLGMEMCNAVSYTHLTLPTKRIV